MQTSLSPSVCRAFLGCQVEKAVDKLNLSKKIISCHPSSLPLSDHVDCFIALNRSPSRLKFSEALLSVNSTFDGSMILFENVVQVLHRSRVGFPFRNSFTSPASNPEICNTSFSFTMPAA